jgi:signal transduction histidine kinase
MSSALGILDAVTGVMLLAAGTVCWRGRPRSRVGALLVLAAMCWFAGSAVGALAFLHRGPLVQLHVSYPTGRVHRRLAAGVIVLAWVAALIEGLYAAPWLTLGLSTLVAVAALDIFTRSSGNARKAGGPALVCALLFAGVLAASSVNRLLGLHLDVGIAATYDVVVMLVAAWLTFDLLLGRWTDATVADLISQLGGEPDPGGLQAALRRALGDPSLVVGYYVASRAGYVDDTGMPLEVRPAGDQVVTTVDEGAAPIAVILHARSALDDPELVQAVTSAVRLAVGNVGLRQTVHEQMDALTEARRRIVEAADRQRSLVAARLEDGAGRHLARVDTLLASLDAAELRSELALSRADLHDLAHGVRPHELAHEGLGGAVAALAARSETPTTVDLRLGRMRPAVESALYFVCAEALTNVAKHAEAQSVVICGRETDGWAAVEVADDGSGGADPAGSGLRGLADRVEALGGQFRVDTPGERGTVVSARIPLATGDGDL